MSLCIPDLEPEVSTLDAAWAYADAGWFVLPVARGSKHPGSVVGKGWHTQSTRDHQELAAWLIGTDHGLALHLGRSGAVALDVDTPEKLPEVMRRAFTDAPGPTQSTRTRASGRGHHLYAMPEGRVLGNGTGRLGKGWGEVRGANGVIIVAPSIHEKAAEGGCYAWQTTGLLPVLPGALATLLDDASPAEDAASDATVEAFLAEHTGAARPDLVGAWASIFRQKVRAGQSRHTSAISTTAGAMKEAAAGCFPARQVAEQLREAFLAAVTGPAVPGSSQGPSRSPREAQEEWGGVLAWAVGQAQGADVAQTLERLELKGPMTPAQLAGPGARYVAPAAAAPAPLPAAGADPGAEPAEEPPARQAAPASSRKPFRDRVLSVLGMAQRPPVEALVDGLLYRDTLAQLTGAPGSGKTFTALALALSVATGRPFAGHQVPRRERVLYVAAEGATGLAARVLAWCHHMGVDPETLNGWFWVLPEAVQLGDQLDVSEAEEFARAEGLALVVIDTRARSTVGLEENSASEMGVAIQAAERIQAAPRAGQPEPRDGAAVLVVHHAGRSGEHGRGSTAWDGAVWSDLRLITDSQGTRLKCAKHKDVEDGCTHPLSFTSVVVPEEQMPGVPEKRRSSLVAVRDGRRTVPVLRGSAEPLVRGIVRRHGGAAGLRARDIWAVAELENGKRTQVYASLKPLVERGFLIDVGERGDPRYALADPQPDEDAA